MRRVPRLHLLAILAIGLVVIGCGRRHYRLRADADAFGLVNEKSLGTPWQLPRSYSVYPDIDSRLADPTNPDFPWLPSPGPILYSAETSSAPKPTESLPQPQDEPLPEPLRIDTIDQTTALRRLPRVITHVEQSQGVVRLASFQDAADEEGISPPVPDETEASNAGSTVLPIQPVPPDAWTVLPKSCLQHMLEFDSVRQEYQKTFRSVDEVPQSMAVRRLGLSEIIDLAIRNSREYQTEEERLYVAALDVSLQRYDYQLKFSPFGNGIAAIYGFGRENDRTTNNSLNVPSTLGVEKTLAKGGTLIAQFANDVVLDFNGSQGVTSRISSDLLFRFTQSVLQRDILLDPLIQSERNLVYAARNFARYRKEFFFDVSSAYYEILKNYRSVEIESQNYLSFVRTLEQARAEVRAGVKSAPPQVEVDQFEQGALSGRSSVIATTNSLERSLDQLKITIGLPTDLPIDVDLGELDQLTLLDEIAVAVERVRRWRRRVEEQFTRRPVQRPDLVNSGVYLIERLHEWAELQRRQDGQVVDLSEIEELESRLRLEQSHDEIERIQEQYDAVSTSGVREPTILVYLRATVLLEAKLRLIDFQLDRLREAKAVDNRFLAQADGERLQALNALRTSRAMLEQNPSDDEVDAMLDSLRPVLDQVSELVGRLDRSLQYEPDRAESIRDEQALDDSRRLLAASENIIAAAGAGLPDIDIDVDEAVLTALIQRLDLMNERGFLADDWRRIKFASDDLRSVLNLATTQRLRTVNEELPFNPFEFDLDSTNTEVRISLDLPLNRRVQRNAYRRALINYQQGRRSLMQLEDSIKFDIRNELRNVELIRVQYPIQVTRAALAAEQVTSIRLQLALGSPDVRGTDLLLALQGSREALIQVARLRIDDLVNRAQFVLDMELMQLDENGFWPQINESDYQPRPNLMYPPAAGPTYGEIPRYVKPTRLMYHLYRHPRPGERIERIRDVIGTDDTSTE